MILTKLKEAKQIDDIKLSAEDIEFANAVKDADPLFSGLRNNSIKALKNIWLSDQNKEFDNTPEGFLDWFFEQYADFGDFVVKEYERIPKGEGRNSKGDLSVFVIRDLALNDEVFANALRDIALEWNCINEEGFDIDTGSKVDIEDIVEILFLQCCNVGVKDPNIDKSLPDSAPHKYIKDPKKDLTPEQRAENKAWLDKRYPDKNVRSEHLLKDLIDKIAEKIQLNENVKVCEKCGHAPCICEDLTDFNPSFECDPKSNNSLEIKFENIEGEYKSLLQDEGNRIVFKNDANPELEGEVKSVADLIQKVHALWKDGKPSPREPRIYTGGHLVEEQEPIAEIPEEPVEAPAIEEPHADVPESVFSDLINSAIQKEWDLISHINSLIATFEFEYKGENKEDLASIFNQLVDDTTINIGMLHKAAELVSSKQAELMDAGEQKAEEIISEPAQDLE